MKRLLAKVSAWTAGLVVVAILAAGPVASARADTAGGEAGAISVDQLMARLRTVRHVDAVYVERRTLRALRTPIETRGSLRFDAPDQLEKASEPGAERLTIRGGQLTIDRGNGHPPVVLMLNEHPEIGVLVESIRRMLAGDVAALRQTFDISIAGNLAGWQIVLQPHDPAQREMLQWMRVTGRDERITAIDTQGGAGDYSEMTITERRP